ncbi:MAG: electron transfer flavoprotein subunit alpha/FixB family protein, partial [Nocardioidaceae bacterium]
MTLAMVETNEQGVTLTSLEALTFARDLAGRRGSEPLHAVLVGPLAPDAHDLVLSQLGEQGVGVVHHAQDERLASYSAAAWAAAVVDATGTTSAAVVAMAGTPRGNEIAAHVATRLDATMAANVVAVEETDPLTVSRQVVGGSALEEMRFAGSPAVFTVAGHATDPQPAEQPTEPDVIDFAPALTDADLLGQVSRTEEAQGESTDALTGARVVVGAGRGAGSADGFGDLLELSDLLGGALGVSRVVTSLGWRPHHEQVGQTGSRIAPDVYIACGISGAIQHLAGCQSAKTIVTINTDPDAPMVTKS